MPLTYSSYLGLDDLLKLQQARSDPPEHDEMLFIIIHQSYELWFKQVLHEVGSVMALFADGHVDDNAGELSVAVHRLGRVHTILQVLVKKIDILETMTPLDFLDFRDMLRPASGFQSMQFKILEAKLGLRMEQRFGKQYYTSQLKPEHKAQIEALEGQPTFIDMVNDWLARMPFLQERYWSGQGDFFAQLKSLYTASLVQGEEGNVALWEKLFETGDGRRLSPAAARSAVFIMLYRDEPILQMPFRLLERLLDIDEALATWRYRHMSMVHRTIGLRVGTGGSTGKQYLAGALGSHHIFQELADLSSFLFERRRIPPLPDALRDALRFKG